MIKSYRDAIPDHGVKALGLEMRELITSSNSALNDKLNNLTERVAELEQTGTLSISGAVINNAKRLVTITVIATDHTTGTPVTVNVAGGDDTNSSGSGILSDHDGSKQTTEITVALAELPEGSVEVTATSTDSYGKAHTDKVVRDYAPVPSSVLFDDVDLDFINRTCRLVATLDIGHLAANIASNSGVTLTMTEGGNPANVIIASRIPDDEIAGRATVVWEELPLTSGHDYIDIYINATDAYGEPVESIRRQVDIRQAADGFLDINYTLVNNVTYEGTFKVISFFHNEVTLELSNAGGSISLSSNDARVSEIIEGDTDPSVDYTNAVTLDFTTALTNLAPEAFTVKATSVDSLGRVGLANTIVSYVPRGKLIKRSIGVVSAAKVLNVDLDSSYIAAGQTVTMALSSAVNGHDEVKTGTVTSDGSIVFNSVNLAAFPFGNINLNISVPDQIGGMASLIELVTFDDVQGSVTFNNETYIDSRSETAHFRLDETGDVTVDSITVTDKNGKSVSSNDPAANAYAISISTLAYGNCILRVDGRDGANRPVNDTRGLTYENLDATMVLDSVQFNPNTKIATIRGTYTNLKAQSPGTPIQVTHYIQGEPTTAVTVTVAEAHIQGNGTFSGEVPYNYPDDSILTFYAHATASKNDAPRAESSLQGYSVGHSGNITTTAAMSNVGGKVTLRSIFNDTMVIGGNVTIAITGTRVLNSSYALPTTIIEKTISLPAGAFGPYLATITATDIYGESIVSTVSFTYASVNGTVSVDSVKEDVAGQSIIIKGTTQNIESGTSVSLKIYNSNSTLGTPAQSSSVTLSGATYEISVPIGPENNPTIKYGTIAVRAEATDIGGTARVGKATGVNKAATGTLSISNIVPDITGSKLAFTANSAHFSSSANVKADLLAVFDTSKKISVPSKSLATDGTTGFTVNVADLVSSGTGREKIAISVSSIDQNGKSITATEIITFNNEATISITSAVREGSKFRIKGSTTQLPKDHSVSVNLSHSSGGSGNSTTTKVDSSGKFDTTISTSGISNGTAVAKASVTDLGGNSRTATANVTWEGNGTITITSKKITYDAYAFATLELTLSASGLWTTDSYVIQVIPTVNISNNTAQPVKTFTVTPNSAGKVELNISSYHHDTRIQLKVTRKDLSGRTVTVNEDTRNSLRRYAKAAIHPSHPMTTRDAKSSAGLSVVTLGIAGFISGGFGTVKGYINTRIKNPNGGEVTGTVSPKLGDNNAMVFDIDVDDRSIAGNYVVYVSWVDGTGATFNYNYTHVKEVDAVLTLSRFTVSVYRYNNGITRPTHLQCNGALSGSGNLSGVRVTAQYKSDGDGSAGGGPKESDFYATTTTATGEWTSPKITIGTSALNPSSGDRLSAQAGTIFGGKILSSEKKFWLYYSSNTLD